MLEPTFRDRRDWTLPRVLEHQADTCGDRPFVQMGEEPALTYSEVDNLANRVAHGLRAAGVGFGDRVAVLLPNCMEYLSVWFGLSKLGAVCTPINTANRGAFLELPLNNSKAKIVVTSSELAQNVAECEQHLDHLECVYLVGDGSVPDFERFRVRPYDELVSDERSRPGVDVSYRDIGLILFTGGTTGPSKGVLMPHSQAYFLAEEGAAVVGMRETDVNVTAFPFFHGNALLAAVYACMIRGAQVVVYPKFSAGGWVDRMRRHKGTVTQLVGATMDFIYKQPTRPDDADNDLRAIFAAPTAYRIVDEFKRRFGVEDVGETFGQTETCQAIFTPPGTRRPPGACGKLLSDWYEARLIDPETDEEVERGEIGELVVRPKVPWITSAGYNADPEGTLKVMSNLWWHTGDGLWQDDEGWFYFVDRTNDALRVRGENVSSYEVEQVMLEHDAVVACAAVSVPAEFEGGEHEIKACVVVTDEAEFDLAEFIAFCDSRMPWFAVPRYVELLTELPVNDHGKVLRAVLRKRGLGPDTWDRLAAGVLLDRERATDTSRASSHA